MHKIFYLIVLLFLLYLFKILARFFSDWFKIYLIPDEFKSHISCINFSIFLI